MNYKLLSIRSVLCLALLLATSLCTSAAEKRKMPSFDQVTMTVEEFFGRESNFKPGDIISRSQVQRLLDDLQRGGWKVPHGEELLDRIPDDSELLVRELRTRDGRKFARQIARYPQAYDRLDRLVRMPTGKSILHRLVKGPDGYKLLMYMTTAPGGDELGRMLSNSASGRDFNKPTGRIYTSIGLIDALRPLYDESWKEVSAREARALGLRDSHP